MGRHICFLGWMTQKQISTLSQQEEGSVGEEGREQLSNAVVSVWDEEEPSTRQHLGYALGEGEDNRRSEGRISLTTLSVAKRTMKIFSQQAVVAK